MLRHNITMYGGYEIENTLTENGFVSRGVCETDAKRYADQECTERDEDPVAREKRLSYGRTMTARCWSENPRGQMGCVVSSGIHRLRWRQAFLPYRQRSAENPLKREYSCPAWWITLHEAVIKVLQARTDQWYT